MVGAVKKCEKSKRERKEVQPKRCFKVWVIFLIRTLLVITDMVVFSEMIREEGRM